MKITLPKYGRDFDAEITYKATRKDEVNLSFNGFEFEHEVDLSCEDFNDLRDLSENELHYHFYHDFADDIKCCFEPKSQDDEPLMTDYEFYRMKL